MASDGTVRIRIGASLDRSVDVVFSQIEKRGQRAARVLSQQTERALTGKGSASPYRRAADEFERSQKRIEGIAERSLRDRERSEQGAFRRKIAMQNRYFAQVQREEEQAARKVQRLREREIDRFATRTSERATRFMFGAPEGAVRFGRRVAGDMLRGAGVDFSVGSSVQRSISLQSAAVGLAQQERIGTGSTRGAGAFVSGAREQGQALGVDPEKIIEMQRAFTGKTGDFAAMDSLLPKLGKMAIAAGSDLGEMGDAAGYVFNQLKDMPDAGERTIDVMRNIVGQTAVGAVEMKDFATQMGRIAANAGAFEGNKATNISKLGALAQLSIATGGATSAADAARAVSAFGSTFKTKARLKAFKNEGIDVFNKKGDIRDPFQLIKESLAATNGDIPRMATLFSSVIGQKPVTALANVYKGAGGGKAGFEAVDKELDKYMRAQIDAKTEADNFADHMKSDAVKAQQFQNQLDAIVATTANKVLPAFERLEPDVLKLADAAGKVANFLADNLGSALLLAITGSIAKAGLESAFRAGLERVLVSAASGKAVQGLGGIGGVSGALTLASIAVSTFVVTKMIVEQMAEKEAQGQRDAALENARGGAALSNLAGAVTAGKVTAGDTAAGLEHFRELEHRIAAAQVLKAHGGPGMVERLAALAGGREKQYAQAAQDVSHIEDLKREQELTRRVLERAYAGVLKVHVVNQETPKVDPRGRAPSPG